jgi:peptide/nickel transport system permease protein
MAVSARTEDPLARRSRLTGVRRAFAPVFEARGQARWMLWLGAAITLAFVFIAVFAPVLAPYDFDTFRANGQRFPQLEAPSSEHLMGTNVQSTDVLSRIIWGAQTELKVVFVSLIISIGVGVPLGLFSGYFGGKLDRALVLIMDALLVFPFLLLAIVIAFLLSDKVGQGIVTAAIAITVVYIPLYFRVVRNHTISIRRPERAAARDAQRGRCDPHARGSRLPRLRDPTNRGGRVGIRRKPGRLGRGLGHLVDGPLPGARDRAPRDRAHAPR